MKILNIKILRGPNYWSQYHKKIIVMKLDLGKYEYLPTNLLGDFNLKLQKLIPSLYEHYCSPQCPGGLFQRMQEGTWLGHVTEHVALELQTLAGMDCGFGRTFGAHEQGVYHVIFSYQIEQAGIYAAKAAVNLVECLATGKNYEKLEKDIEKLKKIHNQYRVGPSTQAILDEANRRKIPCARFQDSCLIILGHGHKQKKIWATISSDTSAIGVDIVGNKELTKQLLSENFIPVPNGLVVSSLKGLENAVKELGFPLVIKPYNGNHGRGITCNIHAAEKALASYQVAKSISNKVIVERFITGFDFRFLVLNYKVVAVAQRTPANVVGDGVSTLSQLIALVNADPMRGQGHENILTEIKIDKTTQDILNDKNLTLNSVLRKGEILFLKDAANLSSGGTAKDITEIVHPKNIKLAQRVARLVNLDICGIDIVCQDITKPMTKQTGAIIEVNACPGFRMHLSPSMGTSRNVASSLIDNLFPTSNSYNIPLIAVTGTNAKTTVVRLIAHIAKQAGLNVGFTTTDGIYLNDEMIYSGDCSGPRSAKVVLQEPLVEYAVLECARGGILRSGLGFNECDISVITNISADHLGIDDIHTLKDLQEVKAVIAHVTKKEGFAILNAEDDLVYAIKDEIKCNIALFGLKENERIKKHCQDNGLAAFVENDQIVVQQADKKEIFGNVKDIPTTFNGEMVFMIQNLLPAILAGVISKFSNQQISNALINFDTSYKNTPGRMNLFDFDNFKVMVDYAHNDGAYLEIKKFLDSINCARKVGIIGAAGDRLAEDIKKLGYRSAQMFDEVIIRHNKDGRGRTNQQLTDLIMQGINDCNTHIKVKVISDECEAIEHAIDEAIPDTFIFYAVDNVNTALNYITKKCNRIQNR